MTKRFGFTLAEVLITLTIIGVIASMTIPTLMNNTAVQENKTGLKKMVSTLNQAITMQYALDGTDLTDFSAAATDTGTTGIFNTTNGIFGAVLMKRMQVMKTTAARDTSKGGSAANATIYLQDGMAIEWPKVTYNANSMTFTQTGGAISKSCAQAGEKYGPNNTNGCMYTILVDVNGDKGKCKVATGVSGSAEAYLKAKDCFPLNVYPDGVRPANYVGREVMYNAGN